MKENQIGSKTILIVDDEALIAMSEADMLRRHGYTVLTAFDGPEAMKKIRDQKVDMVLMDIDLGPEGPDGTGTAEKILEDHEIPIVFLTSHSERQMVERVRGITRYGFALKNCSEIVLIETILRAFELFEAHIEIKRENYERKRAEESLREANSLLEATLNSIPDIIGIQDLDHKMIRYNAAGYKLLHTTPEFVQGKRCFELIGRTTPCENCATAKCYQTKRPETIERYVQEMGAWFDTRTYPILDDDGNVIKVVEHLRDVTEKKYAAEKLKESEEKYRSIIDGGLDHSSVGIFLLDKDFQVLWINESVERYFGISKKKAIGADKRQLIQGSIQSIFERPERFKNKVFATYDDNTYIENFECHVMPAPGRQERWLEHWSQPITTGYYAGGRMEYYTDITKQKISELELREVVKEKNNLMREINHRTKNNIAMISSLVYLKNTALGDTVDLSDLKHQIDAIRIIHEKLNRENSITHIEMRGYLEELLRTIFMSFAGQPVVVDMDVPEISFNTDTAIPLGLILNELATNAVKYGFVTGQQAKFSVFLTRVTGDDHFVLKVSNSGRPFPEDITLENPETLGLRLVSALVNQLGGSIDLQKSPFPVFTISFPYRGEK